MASAARSFTRAATRAATRNSFAAVPRQTFRQQRFYSSQPGPKSSSNTWLLLSGAVAAGGAGFWYLQSGNSLGSSATKTFTPTQQDYQKIYDHIASRLEEKDDYDDGSFGPVLVRLAWHASGTYDKETKSAYSGHEFRDP